MLGKDGYSPIEISLFEDCTETGEMERKKHLAYFAEGKFIFREGLPVNGVYYLIDGAAKIVKTDAHGEEKILTLAKTGDCLGLGSLIDSTHFTASAIAIVNSTCHFIPKLNILQKMETDPSINIKIMSALCKEIDAIEEKITQITHDNVVKRVAELLLDLFRNYGTDDHRFLKIVPSWNDIANIANISNNTLVNVFNDFKRKGIIAIQNKKIRIYKTELLKELAS